MLLGTRGVRDGSRLAEPGASQPPPFKAFIPNVLSRRWTPRLSSVPPPYLRAHAHPPTRTNPLRRLSSRRWKPPPLPSGAPATGTSSMLSSRSARPAPQPLAASAASTHWPLLRAPARSPSSSTQAPSGITAVLCSLQLAPLATLSGRARAAGCAPARAWPPSIPQTRSVSRILASLRSRT